MDFAFQEINGEPIAVIEEILDILNPIIVDKELRIFFRRYNNLPVTIKLDWDIYKAIVHH